MAWLIAFGMTSLCHASENSQFQLDASQSIIYCDITPSFNQQNISQWLKDGADISFTWHIEIESIQHYWFNKQVADIHFKRQVMPDLLSQQWRLLDSLTDIPRRTHSLSQALAFLSHIEHFPIIDKSLLPSDSDYLITVSLKVEKGAHEDAWWNNLLDGEHIIASSILHRP